MANLLDGFYIGHVSRSQNTRVYALVAFDTKYHLTVATRHIVCSKHMLRTREVYNISTDLEPRDWQFSLIDYALHGLLLDNPKEAASIRRRSLRFYYDPILKTLYRRSCDDVLLCYLSNSERRKCLKKHTTAYAELISQVQNSRTDCTGLDIIGQS